MAKWFGWVRTRSNRLEATTFTTLNESLSDATHEVVSRTGAKSVSLYAATENTAIDRIKSAGGVVASNTGTVFTCSDFGWLVIGSVAIVLWPITLTIFIIWFIRWWRKRDVIRGLTAVFVSYLPWSIKLPLRRRYEWLN